MKKYLLKPMMKRFFTLCLGMTLISALGISVLIGMSSFCHSLDDSLNSYVEDYKYPDIFITTAPTSTQLQEAIRWVDGVSVVNTRAVADTVMRTEEGEYLSITGLSHGKDDFYKFELWEQEPDSAEYDNIWLEYNFAQDNDLHVGDTPEVRLGDEYRTVHVSAIITNPETLAVEKVGTWGVDPSYGYVYFPVSMMKGTDYEGLCNQFLIRTQDGYEDEEVLAAVRDKLEEYEVEVLADSTYEESVVNTRIHDNVDPMYTMCVLIPGFFFTVVLCVLFLCIAILIRQCRKNIGILRALGFDVKEIRRVFCAMAFKISLYGTVLGIPIGYFVLYVLADYQRNFFPIPSLPCVFYWPTLALAVFLNIFICQVAAWGSCRMITTIRPVEAMSRELPSTNDLPKVLAFLLKPCRPMFKFSLTTMIRNQKRFWFSVVCIASTSMLFFASVSYNASLKAIVSQIFEERIHYDCMFCLDEQPDSLFMTKLVNQDFVTDAEIIKAYSGELTFQGKTQDVAVNAIDPETDMILLPDNKTVPEEGIVIEHFVAEEMGISVGDTVTFMGVPLEVKDISYQYSCRVHYISLQQAEALDAPEVGTVVCRMTDKDAMMTYLMDCDNYLSASFSDSMHDGITKLYDSFTFVITLLVSFSMAIGTVIVLTTTKTNLIERQRELCVLRTQGFTVGSISFSWLFQALLQLTLSCGIGLPGGVLLANFTLQNLETSTRTYPYASGNIQFLMTVVLVAAYILVSHIWAMAGIRRWNLADTIKSGD